MSPKSFQKLVFHFFNAMYGGFERKMGQIWFQNQSIEICVVRLALRSFLLPYSSVDCSSKSVRRAFVTPFFWGLFASTYNNLHYTTILTFLLLCPLVKLHPSSKNPCSEFLSHPESRDSMRDATAEVETTKTSKQCGSQNSSSNIVCFWKCTKKARIQKRQHFWVTSDLPQQCFCSEPTLDIDPPSKNTAASCIARGLAHVKAAFCSMCLKSCIGTIFQWMHRGSFHYSILVLFLFTKNLKHQLKLT